jgi:hypothetical protein
MEVVLPTDIKDLAEHNRKLVKVKGIIMNLVNDHLIPCIVEKKMTRKMHTTLVTLF